MSFYIFFGRGYRSIYLEGKIIIYMMGNDEKNMLAQVSTPFCQKKKSLNTMNVL